MKDINYALMLLKANRFEGAKDVLEELLQSDPANKDIRGSPKPLQQVEQREEALSYVRALFSVN